MASEMDQNILLQEEILCLLREFLCPGLHDPIDQADFFELTGVAVNDFREDAEKQLLVLNSNRIILGKVNLGQIEFSLILLQCLFKMNPGLFRVSSKERRPGGKACAHQDVRGAVEKAFIQFEDSLEARLGDTQLGECTRFVQVQVDPRVPRERGPEQGFKIIPVQVLERRSHGLKAAASVSQGCALVP